MQCGNHESQFSMTTSHKIARFAGDLIDPPVKPHVKYFEKIAEHSNLLHDVAIPGQK